MALHRERLVSGDFAFVADDGPVPHFETSKQQSTENVGEIVGRSAQSRVFGTALPMIAGYLRDIANVASRLDAGESVDVLRQRHRNLPILPATLKEIGHERHHYDRRVSRGYVGRHKWPQASVSWAG
jgi:hypothetical protein